MRSACAIGLGLAILFASGSARAQEDLTKAKTSPNVTIIVVGDQQGVVVSPVRAGVPAGVVTGWTLVPTGNIPAAKATTGNVNAPAPVSPVAEPFQAMDTNKDGKISPAEFKWPSEVFGSIDANHDGYITRPELTRYLAFVGLISIHEKANAFRTMDTNKDGKISQAEFKGSPTQFAYLDANHDGTITRDEAIKAFNGNVRRVIRVVRLRAMDTNHDGLISATEFKGTKEAFARLDLNHDGMISRVELAQIYQPANVQHVAQTTKPVATAPKVAPVTKTKTKTVTPAPVKAVSQVTTPVTLAPWATRIMALDTNKDGKVCKAEFMKGAEARFARLDLAKKGYITAADLTNIIAARQARARVAIKPVTVKQAPTVQPATVKAAAAQTAPRGYGIGLRYIMAFDANHDGKVCKAEYLKGLEARFTYLDQDKDGYITAADLAKVVHTRGTNPAPAIKPAAAGKPAKTAVVQPVAPGVKTAGLVKKP